MWYIGGICKNVSRVGGVSIKIHIRNEATSMERNIPSDEMGTDEMEHK
jgi:hypothetical protein